MISKKKERSWIVGDFKIHRFSGFADYYGSFYYVFGKGHCLYDSDIAGWYVNSKHLDYFKRAYK